MKANFNYSACLKYGASILLSCFILSSNAGARSRLPEWVYDKLSKYDVHHKHYKGYYKIGKRYKIKGRSYYPKSVRRYNRKGVASWYGAVDGFHGKLTANGDIFNRFTLTAAHKTLPMPSVVKVTNLSNKRSLFLMVNDRGPFKKNRIIDVSEKAASLLGFRKHGIANVKVEYRPRETAQMLNYLSLKPKGGARAKKPVGHPSCSVNCYMQLLNIRGGLMRLNK